MRKLIAAMKISLDGRVTGPDGYADWVTAWSDDYGLQDQVDACVLGGGMYPGYEGYWTAIQQDPAQVLPMTGQVATAGERNWARFAGQRPHYVVSNTLPTAAWPNTHFLRGTGDIAALKQRTGKDIYLVGGARLTGSVLDAGLVDELRLIVHPLVVGGGASLFEAITTRRDLALQQKKELPGGRISLAYAVR